MNEQVTKRACKCGADLSNYHPNRKRCLDCQYNDYYTRSPKKGARK